MNHFFDVHLVLAYRALLPALMERQVIEQLCVESVFQNYPFCVR